MIMEKLFTIQTSNNATEAITYQKSYHEEKLEKSV